MTIDLIPWQTKPIVVLEPAEITWNGGSFSVPRRGYMTPDELMQIREIDPENEIYKLTLDTTIKLRELLVASGYHDIPTSHQLYLLLSTLHYENKGVRALTIKQDPLRIEIEKNYRGLTDEYMEKIKAIETLLMRRSATVMMRRLNESWGDEQTAELPEGIIMALYAFQQEEEYSGRGENVDDQRKAIEEDLKKLQAAVQSIVAERIGQMPTGIAADYGQTLQNFTETASGVSQLPTSLKPSSVDTKTSGKGFIEKS
jgi:hypothetical protein